MVSSWHKLIDGGLLLCDIVMFNGWKLKVCLSTWVIMKPFRRQMQGFLASKIFLR